MRIFVFLFFFNTFYLSSIAQKPKKNIDSLLDLSVKHMYSKPEKSRKYAQKALKIAQKMKLSTKIIVGTRMIGNTYTVQAQHQKAIKYYLKALDIAQQNKNLLEESKTYNVLGVLYEQREYYQKAKLYYQKASNPKAKDLEHIANVLYNLGNVYLKLNETEAALSNFFKAIEIRKKNKIQGSLAGEYSSIGIIYKKQKQYGIALEYLNQACEEAKKSNSSLSLVSAKNTIAEIYLEQDKLSLALEEALIAYETADKASIHDKAMNSLELIAQVYEAQNNYPKAFQYLQKYIFVKDSLFGHEREKEISDIQKQFEAEKQNQALEIRDKKIEILEKEKQVKQTQTFFLILLSVLVLAVAFLIWWQLKSKIKRNKIIFEQKQEMYEAKSELNQEKIRVQELEKNIVDKQLETYLEQMSQKDELIEELRQELDKLSHTEDIALLGYTNLSKILDKVESEEDWDNFRQNFEKIHRNFFTELKRQFPKLTPSETRLCALIKLNLSNKESASILSIAPESVKKARYRIRKKLNLDSEDKLNEFIMNLI